MRNIYIGFSRPKKDKILASFIQKWIGENYSHCYIRFESRDPDIPSTVYHAAKGMVHFIDFERLKQENIVIKEYVMQISELTRKSILIECMKLAGLKYAFGQLPKILIYDIAYKFGKEIKLHDNKGYICSELVGKIMSQYLGFSFLKPLFLVNPKDIDVALSNKEILCQQEK